jgi:hypothetical protein
MENTKLIKGQLLKEDLDAYINNGIYAEKEMLNRTLSMGMRPTVLIGEGERKFASKLKSGENSSYMGAYGEVIPEHSQFEHVKHRIEIWSDIFKHTDRRIAVN